MCTWIKFRAYKLLLMLESEKDIYIYIYGNMTSCMSHFNLRNRVILPWFGNIYMLCFKGESLKQEQTKVMAKL